MAWWEACRSHGRLRRSLDTGRFDHRGRWPRGLYERYLYAQVGGNLHSNLYADPPIGAVFLTEGQRTIVARCTDEQGVTSGYLKNLPIKRNICVGGEDECRLLAVLLSEQKMHL